jgi:benzaldehyde dehydrogenase (NAD)
MGLFFNATTERFDVEVTITTLAGESGAGGGSHHLPFGRNDLDCGRDRAVTEDGGLGTVAVLRRYPVKSMLGEDLRASDVTWRGLTGLELQERQQTVDDEPSVPLGGILDSGTGARFGGAANLDAFTETRWVTMRGDIAP